jgi:hypothetical protein
VYTWLWRRLPGGLVPRTLLAAALLLAVVVLLFTVVFPWVAPRLPFADVTVPAP